MELDKSNRNRTYIIYTCLFILLLPIIFLPFISGGKTFVWNVDGINQHYPILGYYGKLLRGILTGKGFPMVDFKLGMGFDTISTLNYYALGDPLTLLSVFTTPGNQIYIYALLVILRLYLSGISFIIFIRHWKKESTGVILGALIYVFCGYSFYAGVRHPFFVNPMIYLPLLLLGAELVLNRKKPYLFIIMTFISAISNFYFFYVLTVITVIYYIFRYFSLYGKDFGKSFKVFIGLGIKLGLYYIVGLAMSAVLFLPTIYGFLQNGRMNSKSALSTGLLFYNHGYYKELFLSTFASGYSPSYWADLGFSSVIIVSLAILFSSRKYIKLNIILILSFAALMVPAFGYFMNGLAYVANRWDFLISLLAGVIFTVTYDKIFDLNRKEIAVAAVMIAVYGVAAYIFPSGKLVRYGFYMLVLTFVIIILLQQTWFKDRKMPRELILYVLVVFTLGYNGYAYYAPGFHNYVSEFLSRKEVKKEAQGGVLKLIPGISDNSFYRIDTHGSVALNEALTVGYNDVSGYYSIMDGDITNFFKQQELLGQVMAYRFDNLDGRTILDEISCVKYYATTKQTAVPYGYKLINQINGTADNYYLYENQYPLPPGFIYGSYMLRADYDKLSALEKQNALMNAVILEQDTGYAAKTVQNMDVGLIKEDYKLTPDANISISADTINVGKSGGTLVIDFNTVPNSETYVRFGGLNINKNSQASETFTAAADNGPLRKVNIRNKYSNAYFGKENYLINTGYSAQGTGRVTVSFPSAELYKYGSLEVYSLDMGGFTARAEALAGNGLQNVSLHNNRLEGDISLGDKGVMLLSIPVSRGWKAYIDGKKTEVLKADVMFMGLELDRGSHHIVLKYTTPLLKTGCIITLIGIITFILIIRLYGKDNVLHKNVQA